MRALNRQRAFSLVEAMVALVIVSIGLLGVGDLMLRGLREATGALARTQAVYLLSDIMERIRANPDAGDAYDCASYSTGPAEHGCVPSGAPAIACDARQLAEDDLARWQALARQSLPLAGTAQCEANVTYFAAASESEPERYRVELIWRQPGVEAPLSLAGELFLAGGQRT